MKKRNLILVWVLGMIALAGFAQSNPPAAGTTKVVGAVQSVNGATLAVKTDMGTTATVQVQDGTRILRSSPEQKSLKDASPITLADVQAGDRVLAIGRGSDSSTILASTIVVMKQADIAQKKSRELQDWQHRGVGGLVTSVDPAAGTVVVGTSSLGQKKEITVAVTKNTIVRRYAPNSVKFEDAQPGTLDQIAPGDQLRARGNRTEDGTRMEADEIVSGKFHNVSGIVNAKDPQTGTITVNDLTTKKPVVVKITAESQMRKLPEMMARVLAMRLKGETGAANGGNGHGEMAAPGAGRQSWGNGNGANGAGRPGGGDLQSLLNRAPATSYEELQKGEAVMVVTTEGAGANGATAITLLSGVEPILTASPSATILSPWNLSPGGEGGGEGGGGQ